MSKKKAFCIYRFPGREASHLAVDGNCLPDKGNKSFWIAPFTSRSAVSEIQLSVVDSTLLKEEFLTQVRAFPEGEEINRKLPAATSRAAYFTQMASFLKEIRSGRLEKAILSRVIHVSKPHDFDPVDCFMTLTREYPTAFVYLFLHPAFGIWLGASPELLLQKRESEFYTVALAGTQKRKSGSYYSWRKKEIEEHELVGRHIEMVFGEQDCMLKKKGEMTTIESGQVAHLKTEYVFQEKSNISLKKLLSELQPTPAVGGLPVAESVDCILENEGYDREYYCGFLGETDFLHTADLYTNLRCMQIGADHIAVYAGGGITAASDPQEEWEETIMKSKTMVEHILPVKELFET